MAFAWVSLLLLLAQYAPEIIDAVKSLIDAIKGKNLDLGRVAANKSFQLASQIVASLNSRTGLTNEQKREMAWKDLQMAGKIAGIELSESDARTLSELALKKLKNA